MSETAEKAFGLRPILPVAIQVQVVDVDVFKTASNVRYIVCLITVNGLHNFQVYAAVLFLTPLSRVWELVLNISKLVQHDSN